MSSSPIPTSIDNGHGNMTDSQQKYGNNLMPTQKSVTMFIVYISCKNVSQNKYHRKDEFLWEHHKLVSLKKWYLNQLLH